MFNLVESRVQTNCRVTDHVTQRKMIDL